MKTQSLVGQAFSLRGTFSPAFGRIQKRRGSGPAGAFAGILLEVRRKRAGLLHLSMVEGTSSSRAPKMPRSGSVSPRK